MSWRHHDQENAIYLHRIVVNPKYKGQKQFTKVLHWALEHQKSMGRTYLRMDTWGDNPTIIEYYKSYGFREVEFYTNPNTEELPVQQRGNLVILLEYAN